MVGALSSFHVTFSNTSSCRHLRITKKLIKDMGFHDSRAKGGCTFCCARAARTFPDAAADGFVVGGGGAKGSNPGSTHFSSPWGALNGRKCPPVSTIMRVCMQQASASSVREWRNVIDFRLMHFMQLEFVKSLLPLWWQGRTDLSPRLPSYQPTKNIFIFHIDVKLLEWTQIVYTYRTGHRDSIYRRSPALTWVFPWPVHVRSEDVRNESVDWRLERGLGRGLPDYEWNCSMSGRRVVLSATLHYFRWTVFLCV